MQIVKMTTNPDGSLDLSVLIGGIEYRNPLTDWVRLAEEIIEEAETHLIEGAWAADDLRRAFVMGAQWWEYHRTQATMWPSDRNKAEEEAEHRFPGGRPPNTKPEVLLPMPEE